mgnify:CR=1 FL=1
MNKLFFMLALTLLMPISAFAEDTPVSISVISNDAKFIGTSMGGMEIIIRDSVNGEILAKGLTKGSTGNTSLIMADSHERDAVLRSEGSARFDSVLDLDKPQKVEITAYGPTAQAQSAMELKEERILIPGKDYTDGNGIILTMPGMSVDVLTPSAHTKATFDPEGNLSLRANVMKMCGCPVQDKAPWPISRYEVEAHIYKSGETLVQTVPLSFAGLASQFEANLQLPEPGTYEIIVTAFDPKTKDSGMDKTTLVLK